MNKLGGVIICSTRASGVHARPSAVGGKEAISCAGARTSRYGLTVRLNALGTERTVESFTVNVGLTLVLVGVGVPLVRAGVSHRRTLVGGDDHDGGRAVHRAIVHDELDRIGAGEVGSKGLRHAVATQQDCCAEGWLEDE